MFTNKNASDYIREIQSRVLYANYRLQRDRVDGGCASRINIESGSGADKASSTYTDIMTGARFTTAETLSTIQGGGCVTSEGGGEGGGDCAYSGTVLTTEAFTSVGTSTWTAPCSVTSVTYLVVGGGGGGGAAAGTGSGGGGAGGAVKTGTLSVTPGTTYTYTVGAGGAGGFGNSSGEASGEDGEQSVFATIVAAGGGKGFRSRQTNETSTVSKGGAAQDGDIAPTGGSGGGTRESGGGGGGGGGAGGAGSDGYDSSPSNSTFAEGGAGGAGIDSSISGSSVTYGAGGNGGNESFTNLAGTAGAVNTGQGGGGAMTTSMGGAGASGGAGGSGVVLISYYL